MSPPPEAGQTEETESTETDQRALMTREFLMLTGFIASLLDDLAEAPPDWGTIDTRFETLQRLAMVREQLLRGVGLRSSIDANMMDEHSGTGHPVGFSSSVA